MSIAIYLWGHKIWIFIKLVIIEWTYLIYLRWVVSFSIYCTAAVSEIHSVLRFLSNYLTYNTHNIVFLLQIYKSLKKYNINQFVI